MKTVLMRHEKSHNQRGCLWAISGAALQAIKQLNEQNYFDEKSRVVVIFPDHGSKYISKIYSEEWMVAQGFLDAVHSNQENEV